MNGGEKGVDIERRVGGRRGRPVRGIEAVSIHNAGENQPGIKLGGERVVGSERGQHPRRRRGWWRERAEFAFEQGGKGGNGFRNAKAAFGAHALDVALVVQTGMVSRDCKGRAGKSLVFARSPCGSENSVLTLGAAGAFAAQIGLEFVPIFAEVVQQAGEASFGAGVEGGGEDGGELGDVLEVDGQGLLLALVGVAVALEVFGGVGVIGHAGGTLGEGVGGKAES